MEKLMFGIGVAIICMAIVFLVLIGLNYIIKLEKLIFRKSKTKSNQAPLVDEVKAADKGKSYEGNDEIIAVISAAIAAVIGRPYSKIIVRSIKEVGINTPSWALAGRQEQMNERL